MERIVRIVAKNLIHKLPSEKEFFRLDQLKVLDFPEFIVDRVEVEMQRNLDDSIVPPYTEWADMKNRNVQDAWQNFVDAIRSESRLPYAYAPSVIETAVSDALDILIQPRKKIPATLFGADKALDRESLEERAKSVVVYKHLALAPVKYVYRKDLQALTVEQCNHIVSTVDEKLVSRYNALNWAHLLEPLFVLLGDTIDTNLLRIFFQDKKRPRIARKFELMNSSVSRTGLIETLSTPDLVGDSEVDEIQPGLFEEEDKPLPVIRETESESDLASPLISSVKEEDEESDEIPLHSRFMFDEAAINEKFAEAEEYEDENEDESESVQEGYSFNSMFMKQEEDDESPDSEEEFPKNIEFEAEDEPDDEGLELTLDIDDDEDESDELLQGDEHGTLIEEENLLTETEPPESEERKTYIWQHFLRDVDEESDTGIDIEAEAEPAGEVINDLKGARNKSADELSFEISKDLIKLSRADELMKWLEDDKKRFTNELFGGSDSAFEEAINEIAGFEEWKAATRYIEKEIFARNHIDMYDDVAVDFTDRLHSYFTELKPSQPGS